jgi:vacuolar-type H+-ATPase subunit E/Vma4
LGLKELISNLRTKEKQEIEAIWQAAKDEADAFRSRTAEALDEISRTHTDRLDSACQKSRRAIIMEAEVKTREKKLLTYTSLAQSLHDAAVKQLSDLRTRNYDRIFARLAAELPANQWEKISVNPADLQLAAKVFPAEIIDSDPAITGGLIGAAADATIIIDNTFRKRLEKKWAYLLPAILAKIEKEYGNTRTA